MDNFCLQNNIIYVEFEVYKVEDSIKENLVKSRNTYPWFMVQNRELIVSSIVTTNTHLVEVLESNLNFTLYEREQEIDILIDHSTGCLIFNQDRLKTINIVEFAKVVKCLGDKLQKLYIIFLFTGMKMNDDLCRENFLELTKVTNYLKKSISLMVKIVCLENIGSLELLVKRLYLNSLKSLCLEASKE